MAVHGKGSKIFIGGYDFSGQGRSLDLTVAETDIVDATTFASTAKAKASGAIKATIDHKGIFTNAQSGWDHWLHDRLADMSGQPITIIPGVPTEGNMVYNGEIKASKVKVPVKIGDIVGVEAAYEMQGQLGQGKVIAYEIDTEQGAKVSSGYQISGVGKNDMWRVTWHVVAGTIGNWYQLDLQESTSGDISSYYANVSGSTSQVVGVDSKVVTFPGSRGAWVRVVTTQATSTAKYVVAVSKVYKQ